MSGPQLDEIDGDVASEEFEQAEKKEPSQDAVDRCESVEECCEDILGRFEFVGLAERSGQSIAATSAT